MWFASCLKADLRLKSVGLVLGPMVGSHLALLCIHHVNRVNSRIGSAMMTAANIVAHNMGE